MWYALPMITPSSLLYNIGFHITCVYCLLYFSLGILCLITDLRYLKGKFTATLFDSVHSEANERQKDDYRSELDASTIPVETFDGLALRIDSQKFPNDFLRKDRSKSSNLERPQRSNPHLETSTADDLEIRGKGRTNSATIKINRGSSSN